MLYFLTGLGHTVLWLSVQLLNLLNKPHKPQLKNVLSTGFLMLPLASLQKRGISVFIVLGQKKVPDVWTVLGLDTLCSVVT